jgi:hypothetical protein
LLWLTSRASESWACRPSRGRSKSRSSG